MKIGFVYNCQRSKSHSEAEFDTEETIDAIHRALACEGDEVVCIEMTRGGSWVEKLRTEKVDLIFNTAEGYRGIGRESYAPIVFDQIGIPYVGPGPYCCFLTLDKFLTKQVVQSRGVPVPEGYYVSDKKELNSFAKDITYPVFVKPNFEGSSKGITDRSICRSQKELEEYGAELLREFSDGILVEQYIEGKDVTVPYVAGLGKRGVLYPVEYVFAESAQDKKIYDFALKNERDGEVAVRCPANIPKESYEKIVLATLSCVQSLSAADMGRADFRVTENGDIYFIEFNALPSLQPGAGLFEATKALGLTYNETIQRIVSAAVARLKISKTSIRPTRKLPLRDPKIALVYNLKRKQHGDFDYEDEAEFDSQSTVDALQGAIQKQGYSVMPIEANRDLSARLVEEEIDVVFNIAEGFTKRAREAQVPAICDLLGIEHTGSDATTLAISLDKAATSRLAQAEGVQTPGSKLFPRPTKNIKHSLRYPVIVKPNLEGTSKGIYDSSVVTDDQGLAKAMQRLWDQGMTSLLCEEYIVGREFTVGVLGNDHPRILGPMEIQFKKSDRPFTVYSFEAKQLENQMDNDLFKLVCPADLDPQLTRKVHRFAKRAFKGLGCRDVARIDFRIDAKGDLYFIEVNPLPGLSPGFSDLTIMADKTGIGYEELIGTILKPAVVRWRRQYQARRLSV